MLPGKAKRLPSPKKFLRRLAAKATPTPYHGPRVTAHKIFTMCCTGAHLLPKTGNESMLPTTATAHRTAAIQSFLVRFDFITISPLIWLRTAITATFSIDCGFAALRMSVEALWLPLTPEHGFPSLLLQDTRSSPCIRPICSGKPLCTTFQKRF